MSPNICKFGEFVLVFLACVYFYLINESVAYVTVYQTRDLLRGILWFKGQPLFHGPELSGGGYAPGPLFYILSSFFLLFKKSWWSIHYMKVSFAIVSGLSCYYFGKKILGMRTGLFFLFLYLTSQVVYLSYSMDWNASFQPIFSVGCLWLLISSFNKKSSKLLWSFFFLTGLSCQIHGSFISYIGLFLFIQTFAPWIGWTRWDFKAVLKGIPFYLMPSVPYTIWILFGHEFSFFSFSRPPQLEIFWELWGFFRHNFRKGKEVLESSKPIIENVELLKKPFLDNVFIKYGMAFSVFILAIRLIKKEVLLSLWELRAVILFLFITTLYSPFIVSDMSLRYMFHWQIVYIFSAAILFSGIFSSVKNWIGNKVPGVLQTFAWILIGSILTVYAGNRHSEFVEGRIQSDIGRPIHEDRVGHLIYLSTDQVIGICKTVNAQTGWTADQIIRNVFALRLANGWDTFSICRDLTSEQVTKEKVYDPNKIHGYVVFRQVGSEEDPNRWKSWWLEQILPPEFRSGLENGSIQLEEPVLVAGLVLQPYRLLDSTSFPLEAHNTGYGYRPDPGESALLELPMNQSSGTIVSQDSIWFYFNECRWKNQEWCRIGAQIKSNDGHQLRHSQIFQVKFSGTPLSQRVWYLHPYLSMAMYQVSLEYHCDQSKKTVPIVSQLGNFLVEESRNNPFFVTPFERLIKVNCKGPIEAVELKINQLKGFDSIDYRNTENISMIATLHKD